MERTRQGAAAAAMIVAVVMASACALVRPYSDPISVASTPIGKLAAAQGVFNIVADKALGIAEATPSGSVERVVVHEAVTNTGPIIRDANEVAQGIILANCPGVAEGVPPGDIDGDGVTDAFAVPEQCFLASESLDGMDKVQAGVRTAMAMTARLAVILARAGN